MYTRSHPFCDESCTGSLLSWSYSCAPLLLQERPLDFSRDRQKSMGHAAFARFITISMVARCQVPSWAELSTSCLSLRPNATFVATAQTPELIFHCAERR
jgi:hypothetical protein